CPFRTERRRDENLAPLDFLRLHGRLYRFGCDGIFQGLVAAVSVLYHPCGKAYGDRLGALAAGEVIVHAIRQGDRKLKPETRLPVVIELALQERSEEHTSE